MSQLNMFGGRRIVHGTPITPNHLLPTLDGGSFCVSFATPRQLEKCIELVGEDEVLILDNAAFTIWQIKMDPKRELPARLQFDSPAHYRETFWAWANEIQARCPQAIAVIPDVIEGSEQDNLLEMSWALREGLSAYPERTMSIWHLDDSQDFLATQCKLMNFVGIGSTQTIDVQKHKAAYLEVIARVYTTRLAIEAVHGNAPWIHLMRGLGIMNRCAWVDSADSTNVARNHTRHKKHGDNRARVLADIVETRIQNAATKIPVASATC
jgi:hypothetical protein